LYISKALATINAALSGVLNCSPNRPPLLRRQTTHTFYDNDIEQRLEHLKDYLPQSGWVRSWRGSQRSYEVNWVGPFLRPW
jgi:hypothetical protein